MRVERRVVDEKRKIIQITTEDERWYSKPEGDKVIYVPSVTWICDHYPKGIAFYKWLAGKGWDETEGIKREAAERGSKIHQAVEVLIKGGVVGIDTTFLNRETNQHETLSADEYEAVMSFTHWWKVTKPEVIQNEYVIFSPQNDYAGTVDLVCRIGSDEWVIDFKTGQNIWPSYELQVSAYARAIMGNFRLGILQLGYKRNTKKYKFTEVQDKFDLFLAAKQIWSNECANIEPLQREFPLELKL